MFKISETTIRVTEDSGYHIIYSVIASDQECGTKLLYNGNVLAANKPAHISWGIENIKLKTGNHHFELWSDVLPESITWIINIGESTNKAIIEEAISKRLS